jgi:cystathionine beta-lyase
MKYNFDKKINRKNTDSEKFDFVKENKKPAGVIPMWIADMDFETLPQIVEAIDKRAKHKIFGYTEPKEDYFQAVCHWFKTRFDFNVQKDWIVKTPGVICAICAAINAFTKPLESVLIQPPVYYPFARSVIQNKRKLINNPLLYRHGEYSIDFDDFEKKIIENKVKLFIFCSPHNPVGRVWTRDELSKICEICHKHKVIIFSDEIHCDFVFSGYKHIPFATLDKKYLQNIIIATSPSKTFNIAGLAASNIFIPNQRLRKLFIRQTFASGINMVNTFGLTACKAAYNHGAKWVDQLNIYIENNLNFVESFVKKYMPGIGFRKPQGSYLVWLDFNGLKLKDEQLRRLVENKAKLWVDEGGIFGKEGRGFIRINIACPLLVIKKAFNQLRKAVSSI